MERKPSNLISQMLQALEKKQQRQHPDAEPGDARIKPPRGQGPVAKVPRRHTGRGR